MKNRKRVVLKKGKYVSTRKSSFVLALSNEIIRELKPLSKRIKIVGSIRRKEKEPVDIDIILIPKDKQKVLDYLKTKGKFLSGGEKRIAFKIKGVKTEVYYAEPKSWGAFLVSYTGAQGYSIGLRKLAKEKRYLLNQYGLFYRKNKKYIAGKTEKSIYNALGKKWKAPELRI